MSEMKFAGNIIHKQPGNPSIPLIYWSALVKRTICFPGLLFLETNVTNYINSSWDAVLKKVLK
jgi:hypothetical protein